MWGVSLTRAADEVLANFPKSAAIIRQAAMKVAMRRAVVIISEYVRSRQDLAQLLTSGKNAALVAYGCFRAQRRPIRRPGDDPTHHHVRAWPTRACATATSLIVAALPATAASSLCCPPCWRCVCPRVRSPQSQQLPI